MRKKSQKPILAESWQPTVLGKLADYINGYGFAPSDWNETGIPIIRIEQLKGPHTKCDYYDKVLPENYLIENGDLIFSWSASLFLIIWDRGKAYLNQHLFKVKPKANTDKAFLKYLIEFNLGKLNYAAHGSTMRHITRPTLLKFEVNVPTREIEQAKIAEIILTVDEAIDTTDKLIEKYKRIKQGMMQDLFHYGIDENDNIRSEKTHKFKDSPLGRIPEKWDALNVGQITTHVGSGATPTGGQAVYLNEGVKFVRSQNVTFEGIDESDIVFIDAKTHKKMKRSEIFSKDILLNITGASIGRCCIVPDNFGLANVNQHVCAVRLKEKNEYFSKYVSYVLSSYIGQHQIDILNAGGNREGLNYQQVKAMIIPVPKQSSEVLQITTIISGCENVITNEVGHKQKLEALKRGLIDNLLSGKVRVTKLIGGKNEN